MWCKVQDLAKSPRVYRPKQAIFAFFVFQGPLICADQYGKLSSGPGNRSIDNLPPTLPQLRADERIKKVPQNFKNRITVKKTCVGKDTSHRGKLAPECAHT